MTEKRPPTIPRSARIVGGLVIAAGLFLLAAWQGWLPGVSWGDRTEPTRTYPPGRVVVNPPGAVAPWTLQPPTIRPSVPAWTATATSTAPPPVVEPTTAPLRSPTPSPSVTAAPVSSPVAPVPATGTATPEPTGTATSRPASPTAVPTATASPTTASGEPPATPAPAPTDTPVPVARVTGRVLRGGVPATAGITVALEDPSYQIVATVVTGPSGIYHFEGLVLEGGGYHLLFAQAWNEQFGTDEVVSWAWMGPITLVRGGQVSLPDLEIGLQGFGPLSPEAGAAFGVNTISPQTPIVFQSTPFPGAQVHWVDLAVGDDQDVVWRSALVAGATISFGGLLDDGSRITPGVYWWAAGARRPVSSYQLTIYGYFRPLTVTP